MTDSPRHRTEKAKYCTVHSTVKSVLSPVVVVLALKGRLGSLTASTSPDTDTATTVNVYSVPGSRPVTLAVGLLPSIVTLLSSPLPTFLTVIRK